MPKKGEARVQKAFKLRTSVVEKLNKVAEDRMIGPALIVERALEEFFEKMPSLGSDRLFPDPGPVPVPVTVEGE